VSDADKYEAIFRRIEDIAGIDRTPRLLKQINTLELSEYEKRHDLLLDIGYEAANFEVWRKHRVFTQCEWTTLLLGLEPMKLDAEFPTSDRFGALVKTVDAWLVVHRLMNDWLRDAKVVSENPGVVKQGSRIQNDSYSREDFIKAANTVGLPIPPLLLHSPVPKARPTNEGPEWVFRKSNREGFWEIGIRSDPILLKALSGFEDIAYAIKAEGHDFSPLALPGSQSIDLPDTTTASDVPCHDEPWTGFGSDDVADNKARASFKDAEKKLLDDIEIAQETGDSVAVMRAQTQLDELKVFMQDTTRPGGKPRKLSAGDPIEKAASAARERKRRAIKALRRANLDDMADHLDKNFRVAKRQISYVNGLPFPEWQM
jgi:hypothetical protein